MQPRQPQLMAQLKRVIPEAFDHVNVLYIGASQRRAFALKELAENSIVTVVEAFKDNAEYITAKYGVKVICEDIRKFDCAEKYSAIFWFDGPEHVMGWEAEECLDKLWRSTKSLLVASCPNGLYRQGPIGGNKFEIHASTISPQFFLNLGFKVSLLGKANEAGNILAWRYR